MPAHYIKTKTQRVPYKHATMNLSDWKSTFCSWPSKISGWRSWYLCMAAEKGANWEDSKIGHFIRLSLAEMDKNEPLLVAATYFWSDALNAFLFGHGPISPCLLDVCNWHNHWRRTRPFPEYVAGAFCILWIHRRPYSKYVGLFIIIISEHKTPPWKFLLGSVYRLMHHTTIKLRAGETIDTSGPWWFVQL